MTRHLIVAATSAEAAYVPQHLPVVITGLGKTAAAAATVQALARCQSASGEPGDLSDLTVLNIGTAGALRDGLSGLFLPGAVLNHDLSAEAIRALGYDPQERLELDVASEVVLATGDVFVSDPRRRSELAQRAHLVDMEGYAVAYACHLLGVRCVLVKHVSDNADESALDWTAAVDASAQVLGEWVVRETASA